MNKKQFIQWAEQNNWKIDRWGNLKKTIFSADKTRSAICRFKIGKISVRYEQQYKSDYNGNNVWVKRKSAYYKNLSINPTNNKIQGFTR